MMITRRLMTVIGAAFAVLMLTATSAFAGLCYNASRSETGNANATNGQALGSAAEFIAFLGSIDVITDDALTCDPEAAALEAAILDVIDDTGLTLDDVVVNERTVMAQGVVGTELSDDNRGIDHLLGAEDEIHDAIECLEGALGALG